MNKNETLTIGELVKSSYSTAVEKGWHEEQRSIPELLCLIHSEISEALEEHRNNMPPELIYYKLDKNNKQKPEGIPIELADAVIRITDMCGLYNIDLEEAIKIKTEYNRTRSYKHGNKKC